MLRRKQWIYEEDSVSGQKENESVGDAAEVN
jgi:hypothetical protein